MSASNPEEPVGTVAQEAARLLEVLSASGLWGAPTGEAVTETRRADQPSADQPPMETPRVDPRRADPPPAGPEHAAEEDRPQGVPADEQPAPCHHPPVGEATVCALCPVCQGIALVRSLQPEALDALANLAAVAAATLRDLARAAAQEAASPAASAPTPPSTGRAAVVDIEVVDGPAPGGETG